MHSVCSVDWDSRETVNVQHSRDTQRERKALENVVRANDTLKNVALRWRGDNACKPVLGRMTKLIFCSYPHSLRSHGICPVLSCHNQPSLLPRLHCFLSFPICPSTCVIVFRFLPHSCVHHRLFAAVHTGIIQTGIPSCFLYRHPEMLSSLSHFAVHLVSVLAFFKSTHVSAQYPYSHPNTYSNMAIRCVSSVPPTTENISAFSRSLFFLSPLSCLLSLFFALSTIKPQSKYNQHGTPTAACNWASELYLCCSCFKRLRGGRACCQSDAV